MAGSPAFLSRTDSRRKRTRRPRQGLLAFPCGHGGARPNAGRKAGPDGRVRHRQRAALASRHPVHVTLKLRRGLPRLRQSRTLNRIWQRRGGVFADRYHERVLTTPREVRNVLRYVLGNAWKHAAAGGAAPAAAIDVFTSAPWFDGFREPLTIRNLPPVRPTADPCTWLLRQGWRRHGLLSVHELPELPATG